MKSGLALQLEVIKCGQHEASRADHTRLHMSGHTNKKRMRRLARCEAAHVWPHEQEAEAQAGQMCEHDVQHGAHVVFVHVKEAEQLHFVSGGDQWAQMNMYGRDTLSRLPDSNAESKTSPSSPD
jgi:hypothetical protein